MIENEVSLAIGPDNLDTNPDKMSRFRSIKVIVSIIWTLLPFDLPLPQFCNRSGL